MSMDEEHPLNDSLGNSGLISPDKEDLSRLLVRNAPLYLFCVAVFEQSYHHANE